MSPFNFSSRIKRQDREAFSSSLTEKENDLIERLYRAYDIILNCSNKNTDDIIVGIFAKYASSCKNMESFISNGYGRVYIKAHQNTPYEDRKKISLSFSDWTLRVKSKINCMEDC